MSPLVHVTPLLLAAVGAVVIARHRLGAWWSAWTGATVEEDPRVRELFYEAARFGSSARHGVWVRRVSAGWWVGPRFVVDERSARDLARQTLGGGQ